MNRVLLNILSSIVLSTLIMGCELTRPTLGSSRNPIKLALLPGQSSKVLEDNGKTIQELLEKSSDLKFQISVPTNYVAIIEAMGTERADLAVLSAFGFLLAEQKHQAKVLYTFTANGKATYQGQIIALKNGGPKSIKDLQGKSFAFVDPLSASGYLLPAYHLKKEGIKLAFSIFAGRHDAVVSMVYQKQVFAGATFFIEPDQNGPRDARALVKTQYPDVFEKISIIGMTEPLPNEGLVIRKGIEPAMEAKIKAAFQFAMTQESGRKAFEELYHVNGIKEATSADYVVAKDLLQKSNKALSDLIK